MKYKDYAVTFREFPDEISLCINISNCPFHCPGCHSPELWEDVGTELTVKELHKLISHNKGITLIGFMGGNIKEVSLLAEYIKNTDPSLKVGWYTGGLLKTEEILKLKDFFDYIKIGPYIEEKGGLDKPTTNQRMYQIDSNCVLNDITYKFRSNENNN